MKRQSACALLLALLAAFGCGDSRRTSEIADADTAAARTPPATTELDPDNPELIVRPFTADEIRDAWVEGLRLLVRRSYPEETRVERWTVVSADEEGAEIEYATIAEDGSVAGEPSLARSTWAELRDHASFAAAYSTRRWVSRSTQLGDFDGWLYRVADPSEATVEEFFFVPELPGAPVHMRITEGDTTIFELEQTARLRPQ